MVDMKNLRFLGRNFTAKIRNIAHKMKNIVPKFENINAERSKSPDFLG